MKKLLSETCDSIVKVDTQWDFAYDGDGSRVKQVVSTYDPDTQSITGVAVTAYFMGGLFEVNDNKVTKYYSIAGLTVAMFSDKSMKYLLTDHLGLVVAVTPPFAQGRRIQTGGCSASRGICRPVDKTQSSFHIEIN